MPKTKKVTQSQLRTAQREGAKVKAEQKAVTIEGLADLSKRLEAIAEMQKQTLDVVSAAIAAVAEGSKDGTDTTEIVAAMRELSSNLQRSAVRPIYHFSAERTDNGFDITATPRNPTIQ
jgi:hypothetical protein